MMNEIGGDGVKKSDPSTRVNRRDFLQQAGMASVALAAGAGVSNQILAQGLPRPGAADWRRFGYDLHNTRFNSRETVLGPDNVSRLKRVLCGPTNTSSTALQLTGCRGINDERNVR